jgi:hypothetical protein
MDFPFSITMHMDNNVNVTSSTSSVKPNSGVKARITDMRDDKARGSKPLANHTKLATGEHDFTFRTQLSL